MSHPTWIIRRAVRVQGVIQGVGFRPFVYLTASSLGLTGFIQNQADGVYIEIQGPRPHIQRFLQTLRHHPPSRARIDTCLPAGIPSREDETAFTIRESRTEGTPFPLIPADAATCAACLAEMRDRSDPRYRYPFTHCTHCGPRFSMTEGVPYDRRNTTMKHFPLCPSCRRQYEDPGDRRFHAQPIACPGCGPRLEGYDPLGGRTATGEKALAQASQVLRHGGIVALKGLGGFQLVVDALNEEAVGRLRLRKDREEKPFALMFSSLDHLRRFASVTTQEAALLRSPEAPIVLVRRRTSAPERGWALASGVSGGSPLLGVMLPYTPLHRLLMQELERPVVCTSGNIRDEPICIENREALQRLRPLADFFLWHDRPIARHVDDSVVRVVNREVMFLRRARGYAPDPVPLAVSFPPLLATGAHLKNTVAVSLGPRAILSQHIGDLATGESYAAFQRVIEDLLRFFRLSPQAVACDAHPDYLSTRFAESYAAKHEIPLLRIQHHHAHVAACMAEHHIEGEVLGVAWDGAGYGPDGSLWGGEFLLCDGPRFRRVAHLRPYRLPGGERAIREPRRAALGILVESGLDGKNGLPFFNDVERRILSTLIRQGIQAPRTTSMGRLFDAVASLLGLRQRCTFEGQAAMALENLLAGKGVPARNEGYPFPLLDGNPWVADWGPMIAALLDDHSRGVPLDRIASRFHAALVELILRVAERAAVSRVVLSGGCFQNAYLAAHACRRLREAGFQPLTHRRVPPNDGGIALGQLYVAGRALEVTGEQGVK